MIKGWYSATSYITAKKGMENRQLQLLNRMTSSSNSDSYLNKYVIKSRHLSMKPCHVLRHVMSFIVQNYDFVYFTAFATRMSVRRSICNTRESRLNGSRYRNNNTGHLLSDEIHALLVVREWEREGMGITDGNGREWD